MWRTVRTLAVAFLLISGVGALVEERGIGKGILNNPDMRPQLETKTKFADVKGVDEAKARAQNSQSKTRKSPTNPLKTLSPTRRAWLRPRCARIVVCADCAKHVPGRTCLAPQGSQSMPAVIAACDVDRAACPCPMHAMASLTMCPISVCMLT